MTTRSEQREARNKLIGDAYDWADAALEDYLDGREPNMDEYDRRYALAQQYDRYIHCDHKHIDVVGSVRFYGGDVIDTQLDYCDDCRTFLSSPPRNPAYQEDEVASPYHGVVRSY